MKNINYIFLLTSITFSSLGCAATPHDQKIKADQLNQVLHVRGPAAYTYPTKFGDMKFIREDGTLGDPAETIILNGEVLISTKGKFDAQGGALSLGSEIMTSTSSELTKRKPGQAGKTETKRMIFLVGQGTCTKQFLVLDFTGEKPFVSEKFGNDQNDRFCLSFKKAKWEKKESEIILDGPVTYIYSTHDKIAGPFVFE
ncbi:hypothetical protein LJR289_002532 [Pseudoduganella sp. LjRoot289]|uniref:hypothetical protein n=1 Tax=Pseudoduganella sp. LjRoot289 TaxID=3342314 RepID=UPI003ED0679C